MQGEPLDGDTFTWATETFDVPVVNAYGQTETGSTWTYPVHGVDDLKAGSVGTPVPGHAFEVLDDDGEPVPAGVKGNLVITRPFPTLARTVWDDHERYLATYFSRFPGSLRHQRRGRVDHDGHLWVLGRADDVINVAAHRISTMEIEAVVIAHPARGRGRRRRGARHAPRARCRSRSSRSRPTADRRAACAEIGSRWSASIGGYARLDRVLRHPRDAEDPHRQDHARLLRDVVVHG